MGLLENDGSSQNASTCTLASLYIGSSKNIVVLQHIHYSYRWASFVNYSLYEFAALVDIVKKNISSSTRNNDSLNPSDEKDISSGLYGDHLPAPTGRGATQEGRPSNGTFRLAKSHQFTISLFHTWYVSDRKLNCHS